MDNCNVVNQFEFTDRTAELRKYGYTGRRLGPVQMTTDTAVRVTRIVVEDKGSSSNICATLFYTLIPSFPVMEQTE